MQRIPLEGQRFGRLVVVAHDTSTRGRTMYQCRCDCGAQRVVAATSLRNGDTRSCGCLRAEVMREKQTKHGRYGTPTYRSWRAMLARCSDITHKQFKDYGGRGVRVCDTWRSSFESFLADMGERPSNTTIDRIETNGHYQPGNCRWATRTEQNRNKRTAKQEKQ